MGLTKQYLRYVPLSNFNTVCHPDCNIIFVTLDGISDRFVAVGACENVIIWDMRLAKLVMTIEDEDMKNNTLKKITVVKLATTSEGKHIAVGYSDGLVNTFDLTTGKLVGTFQGHRSAITALSYDSRGYMLASGSKDTEAVIWDVIAEKGLYRLSGHKGVVTAIQFMNKHNIVVTSSKDTYIKFWDLTTGHCFKTLAGHITEVWTLSILRDDDFIVSGSNDSELRTWMISKANDEESEIKMSELLSSDTILDFASLIKCEKSGSLIREGSGRVVFSATDNSNRIICSHGHGKLLELFMFSENKESLERFSKRQKKLRKKALKFGENFEDTALLNETKPALQDIVKRLPSILTDFKIKSADLVVIGTHVKVVVSLANNSIVMYSVPLSDSKEIKQIRKISLQGHRSNVKDLAFSSDNLAVFTGGSESVKMWNRKTLNCIRTVETLGPVQCLCVGPDDGHIFVGLENGHLLVIDIRSGDIIETLSAHLKCIKSIYMLPDRMSCVTCGDSTVKLWKFELVTLPNSDRKVLSLLHYKTLQLDDNIMSAKASPDNKLLAVALLDNTIKIFFLDTFKHFIDLYGHTLPINDMDISYDSSIIVTISADKTIRIWGLDYGDCHRRLMTDSALTGIKFIPKTHQFFTSDKNGNVKFWDADISERILTLQGHRGECYNLSVSENGYYVISCGQDNVIRLYEKTDETLVLEDQHEEERLQGENELATGEETHVHGSSVLSLPTKKTVTSEKAAELLLECLNVIKDYKEDTINMENPTLPIIMTAFNVKTTDDYLLEVIKRIRSSELEEVLLLMPFSSICYFMKSLIPLLNHTHHDIEPVVRSLVFLVQTLHKPISSVKDMQPVLRQLHKLATKKIDEFRDLVGENLHSLIFMNNSQEEEEVIFNISQNVNKKRKRRARKILNTVVVNI